MDAKTIKTLNDLRDLSMIKNKKKSHKMSLWILNLDKYYQKYKVLFTNLKQAQLSYGDFEIIPDSKTYKLKKEIIKKIIKIESEILKTKSKLSKYINKLVFAHMSKANKKSNITADELYKILLIYEKQEFKNNYFPYSRLKAIINNNKLYRNCQFQLIVAKTALNNTIKKIPQFIKNKGKKILKKQINILNKKIVRCQDRKKSLYDAFLAMQHAKLVKMLDAKSQKFNKKTKDVQKKTKYIIDLENVTKYYYNKWVANKVLKNVNLKIEKGEFVVILGPSGSGKTTLLNIISGMDKATYGKTIINNTNLIWMNDKQLTKFRKNNIGYIFQQYGLLPNLNVRENIEIGWELQKNKDKRLDIDELLTTVGMQDAVDKFPHELSGGQQQRVSVARSMAKNPAIVFGDEPTGAVDQEMSKKIMQLFVDINKKFKTTVIIVTHNPIFADLADRVIKVNSGNILYNSINKKPKQINELNWLQN